MIDKSTRQREVRHNSAEKFEARIARSFCRLAERRQRADSEGAARALKELEEQVAACQALWPPGERDETAKWARVMSMRAQGGGGERES